MRLALRLLFLAVLWVVGLAVSLFTAGPALFANGPIEASYAVLPWACGAFFLLGAFVAFLWDEQWVWSVLWVASSTVPVPLFFTLTEELWRAPAMLALAVLFVVGPLACALLAGWGVHALRSRPRWSASSVAARPPVSSAKGSRSGARKR